MPDLTEQVREALDQAIDAAIAHRETAFHDVHGTCGGCHWYSGYFSGLVDCLPENERASWWEQRDAALAALREAPDA